MSTKELDLLKQWLQNVGQQIADNQEPSADFYQFWVEKPKRVLTLIDWIDGLDEASLDDNEQEYSACIVAMDICVVNLQSAVENGHKASELILNELMAHLTDKLLEKHHSLSFWMPILNAFYEAQVDLSPTLKNAYVLLASEEELDGDDPEEVLQSIRDLILSLSPFNTYEIAEHIFAQSYVMHAELFAELLFDLFSLEEGQDVGVLSLLHPNAEVRKIALQVMDQVLPEIRLSSESLSRLQAIAYWYPDDVQPLLKGWIKHQRKQGVVFAKIPPAKLLRLRACEIDGTGSQGIIIRLSQHRKSMIAGVLLKKDYGIKDVWVNTFPSRTIANQQFKELFNSDLYSREVDLAYFEQMANHFLYEALLHGQVPDLQMLYLQELLGVQFIPCAINLQAVIEKMSVQIRPFTPQIIEQSLKKSAQWLNSAPFAQSWLEESAEIDALVNQCCTLDKGMKICDLSKAVPLVMEQIFAKKRKRWCFHFVWNALWLAVAARSSERSWRDCLLIAYYIENGGDLMDIPIMRTIANQSVINSMETMTFRRTHLTTLQKI